MATKLEVESTLTDRYQTTVPETVRRALRLGKRDKIHYTTLRAYESDDDAYRVFRKMLDSGHPPDDWDSLLSQAKAGMRSLR